MGKRTASSGLGSIASGAVTALAIAVQSGLAAVVGVILARELGRSAETDGFFAAYGVFVVLALAATALRVTLLPALARARAERRLASETAAYAELVTLLMLPPLAVGVLAARPVADVLTGAGSATAVDAAADALPWMIVAGVGQFTAGLLASALAALDDYLVAAVGYVAGSVSGLALILLRIDEDRTTAIAWGMALNAILATVVPAVWLSARAWRERMPRHAARARRAGSLRRLAELARGAALPFALQAIYLVCLPLAARDGEGALTTFGYAYLAAAALVGVSASSLGLVTAVPLTRTGLDAARVTRHVESASWLALAAVSASAGVLAVAGAGVIEGVLGDAYGDDVGAEIGRVVVALGPYMVASIGLSVTFPLLFVAGRTSRLPLVALAVLAAHLPLALAGQALAGLYGLSVALALSTGVALAWMLHILGALGATVVRLGAAVGIVGGCALASFALSDALLGAGWAALVGVALTAGVLLALRPPGLTHAWRYLRELS